MMKRTKVVEALQSDAPREDILVQGWVRTKRESKGFCFLELNDGSGLKNLQAIVDDGADPEQIAREQGTGAAVSLRGDLVASPGKEQAWELQAREITLLGGADPESYPLQKKRHSDEFLRSIAHLRVRTNKYGAVNRIRSKTALAIHNFFQERGFHYIHTPIITASDCEGAGELFRVTAQEPEELQHTGYQAEEDFFGKKAFLTVSGQLTAEIMACGLGQVYTFGPTFRAENSNTPRHAAEFWMIEPEMAFADLTEDIDLAEALIKSVINEVRTKCADDVGLFARFVDKSLLNTLDQVEHQDFVRLPYKEAVELLRKSGRSFEYPVELGQDLQTEHERYLAEEHFKGPVVVYDYPKSIKPFYMRVNDDGETVAGMDILLPKVGEIIGGSQREERLDVLLERMEELGLDREEYGWYLDLRRFGTVPHAGFGLGFERLLMFLTGVHNIRDVLPFPRTPKHLEF